MPSSVTSFPTVYKYGSVALLTSICFLYSSIKMSSDEVTPKVEDTPSKGNDVKGSFMPEEKASIKSQATALANGVPPEQIKNESALSASTAEAAELQKKQKKLEKNKRRKERKLANKLKTHESTSNIPPVVDVKNSTEISNTEPVDSPSSSASDKLIKKEIIPKSKNQKHKERKQVNKAEQQRAERPVAPKSMEKLSLKNKKHNNSRNPELQKEKKLLKAEQRKRQKAANKSRLEVQVQNTKPRNGQEVLKNKLKHKKTTEVSVSSKLVLNAPLHLNLNLFDSLEFFCDCCPVELTGYEAASNHINDFNHNKMSVVHGSLSDIIKCQSCGETDLSKLNSILLTRSSLSLCCNQCLENSGFDPLIYSFSTPHTLLKYVDNMYRLNSLSCFNCGSEDHLAINEDLTCYCAKCIEKDNDLKNSKLVKRSDESFLSTLFEDIRYSEFKHKIDAGDEKSTILETENVFEKSDPLSSPSSPSTPLSAEKNFTSRKYQEKESSKGKKTDKKKPNNTEKSEGSLAKDKENKPPLKSIPNLKESRSEKDGSKNFGKQMKAKENSSSSSAKSQRLSKSHKDVENSHSSFRKAPKNLNSAKRSEKLSDVAQPLLSTLSVNDLKIEDKFEKLKTIVKETLPKNIRLKFDDMNEYNNYLSYSLFLEELFSQDICTDVEFEWKGEDQCVMTGPTKLWFDMYVNDDVHHLKKHPFTRDQPIFIVRKSDSDLRWTTQPDFWLARVSGSSLAKIGKKGRSMKIKKHAVLKKTNQISTFTLELYPWNSNKFPVNERGDRFAFLPGSNVVGRILNSMNKIENDSFKNLILGKEKVKIIKFENKINKYFNVLNESQKHALQSALNNTITILQGPPGSGKTSTIYEIILQLLSQLHYYPILVVAASNLAVDNIAEKLMGEHKDIILRITSLAKEKEYPETHPLGSICLHNKISNILPPNLKDIENRLKRNASNVSSSEFSKYLDACQLYGDQLVKQANIIFATTAGIAGPYLKKVKRMPVIIMDEATQSSEPSSLIPLGAQGCNKVILVGDTAQLSVFTRVKSLEMSLFQRVLENGTYENPYMLDTQYRMHPDISHFSREHFYDNKLKDGITAENRKMPGIKYPVYFFDHQGVGASETKMFSASGEEFGFSWVNKKEVSYIERILEKLIVDHQVPPSTIGVMTGYAAQRDLIVKALENNKVINPNQRKTNKYIDKEDLSEKKNVTVCNVNGIIVATIDAYQGREMNFVLLSCVRSNEGGNIGFMSDKRRMNVALTRAKYSFIICGDARCMSSNKLWREYIEELQGKGYVKNSINEY